MLISPVILMILIYRLPHDQNGYNGHIINLPQDISTFVDRLPWHLNGLDVIVVKEQNSSESHNDFQVRSKVVSGLQWVVANNIYFRNATVDDEIILSYQTMATLSTVTFPVVKSDEPDPSTLPEDPYTVRTFVPGLHQSRTEAENVRQSLEQSSTVMWPNRDQHPINEFNMEGYFS